MHLGNIGWPGVASLGTPEEGKDTSYEEGDSKICHHYAASLRSCDILVSCPDLFSAENGSGHETSD